MGCFKAVPQSCCVYVRMPLIKTLRDLLYAPHRIPHQTHRTRKTFSITAQFRQSTILYKEAYIYTGYTSQLPLVLLEDDVQLKNRAGIFKKSVGARNRRGIGLTYRPARLRRLAEFIPWNQFRGPINI